ncbi:hypothetical protein PTSG_12553 [Salpingoeca rosetta]|uniref:RRM domain-containing protein n=1 Tax=Salpingoeca rosetta (strain ATCC 50818 / BSB-021) TaxID=946362 RepID=F2UEC8_SALR5|nr:uncharacterized protein PTSG_12553 [Salpingoeca rosetta]EGD74978.1 hypothetical protein PTSG_12553 [Salpingoeca rosetta]|eukprot:XP_004992623.1 hypothetical protein PTSG_12553 [Salpingoeca rosetta]
MPPIHCLAVFDVRKLNAADLRKVGEVYGRLSSYECRGRYGFLRYENPQDAERVLREVKETTYLGMRLRFEPANSQNGEYRYRPDPSRRVPSATTTTTAAATAGLDLDPPAAKSRLDRERNKYIAS